MIGFSLILLVGTAVAPADDVRPPQMLARYIRDGQFEPGDYRWMRGRFADAPPSERAAYRQIQNYLGTCFKKATTEARAELVAMGETAPALPQAPYGDSLCGDIGFATGAPHQWSSWKAFAADRAAAAPITDSLLWAVDMAIAQGGPRGENLDQKLLALPLGEQMLRTAGQWQRGPTFSTRPPTLSPGARAIVDARLSMAMSARDGWDTQYLKKKIDEAGWPKISVVGSHASDAAWLIVQHADRAPAFQLKVLLLMEPLVARGEVSKTNYAYLYDRIMLKLRGVQRYGTQMTCAAGQYVPLPLDESGELERRRSEVGLPNMADYRRAMVAQGGACPR